MRVARRQKNEEAICVEKYSATSDNVCLTSEHPDIFLFFIFSFSLLLNIFTSFLPYVFFMYHHKFHIATSDFFLFIYIPSSLYQILDRRTLSEALYQ